MIRIFVSALLALCLLAVGIRAELYAFGSTYIVAAPSSGQSHEVEGIQSAGNSDALVGASSQSRRTSHSLKLHLAEVVESQDQKHDSTAPKKRLPPQVTFLKPFYSRQPSDRVATQFRRMNMHVQGHADLSSLHVLLRVFRI